MRAKKIKYQKKIVTFSIAFIVLYTVSQVYLSYELQIELSPTLTTCVYAFFGTELASSAFIKINELKYGDKKDEETKG